MTIEEIIQTLYTCKQELERKIDFSEQPYTTTMFDPEDLRRSLEGIKVSITWLRK